VIINVAKLKYKTCMRPIRDKERNMQDEKNLKGSKNEDARSN